MKIAKDKMMHAGVCAAISLAIAIIVFAVGGSIVSSALAGFLGALSCGLGKEYGDCKCSKNVWDNADLLADAIGGFAGAFLSVLICLTM